MSKVFAAEHTRALQEVIREIEVDPAEFKGVKYMPSVDMPTAEVFVDVIQARGGLIKEHTLGSDPQAGQRRQFHTQSFSAGSYREFIRFNEKDILRLRELGLNDQSKRGIRQHLNENALVLNNKIEARMEKLRWEAIFNGTYVYDGKTVDFGRPAANNVSPIVPWGILQGGIMVANPAAKPVEDMRFWLLGAYAPFRKYVQTAIIMNPNTARLILDNPNVQSLIQNRFASESYKMHDINAVMSFLVPGCPPIEIYKGWYQDEAIDATTGLITVSDAIFFIPDGAIFFECKLPDNNKVGDIAMTLNLSAGSIDNPTAGKFILVKEHIQDKSENPYIDVIGGFMGGPRLKRAFDLLTAQVY